MTNAVRTAVKKEAIRYTTEDLGWTGVTVTGIIEGDGERLVAVAGRQNKRQKTDHTMCLRLEDLDYGWSVTDECDIEDYERNNTLDECSYCCALVPADHLVSGVCRKCNRNGIEA